MSHTDFEVCVVNEIWVENRWGKKQILVMRWSCCLVKLSHTGSSRCFLYRFVISYAEHFTAALTKLTNWLQQNKVEALFVQVCALHNQPALCGRARLRLTKSQISLQLFIFLTCLVVQQTDKLPSAASLPGLPPHLPHSACPKIELWQLLQHQPSRLSSLLAAQLVTTLTVLPQFAEVKAFCYVLFTV